MNDRPIVPNEDAANEIAKILSGRGFSREKIIEELTRRGVDQGMAVFVAYQQPLLQFVGERSRLPGRLSIAIMCLRISRFLYAAFGISFFLLGILIKEMLPICIFYAVISLGFAALMEFVARGLKKLKFWAWVTGIILFGLFLPSCFLPIGAFGLWGLLDEDTRKAFPR